MSPVKFFTPIVFCSSLQTSFKQSALQFVDDYFFLKGAKAQVFNLVKAEAHLVHKNSSFAMKCIKVSSYFSILLPLLMVSTKIVERVQNRVIFEPSSNAWRYSKAASFLSLVPIIMFIAKVILRWNSTYQLVSQNTIQPSIANRLGLDLTETAVDSVDNYLDDLNEQNFPELDPKIIDRYRQLKNLHKVINLNMGEAVIEVLNAINQGLDTNNKDPDISPGDKNIVHIEANKYPWNKPTAQGKLGLYNVAVTGESKIRLPENERTWLNRILKALESNGFITIISDSVFQYTVAVNNK